MITSMQAVNISWLRVYVGAIHGIQAWHFGMEFEVRNGATAGVGLEGCEGCRDAVLILAK